jgi:plastocyanin
MGAFVVSAAVGMAMSSGKTTASARTLAPLAAAAPASTADASRAASDAPDVAVAAASTAPAPTAPATRRVSTRRPATPRKPTAAKARKPKPLVRPGSQAKPVAKVAAASTKTPPAPQSYHIRIGTVGYEPSTVKAHTGSPITLVVGKGQGCAAGFEMPSLGVSKDNSSGQVSIHLGRLKSGTYTFTCGMGMIAGQLVVR